MSLFIMVCVLMPGAISFGEGMSCGIGHKYQGKQRTAQWPCSGHVVALMMSDT